MQQTPLFKICNFVPIDVLILLHFSFVHCHLNCGFISLDTANRSALPPLSVLQNNILWIMTFSKYRCHITPLYKNLKLLKLNNIYQIESEKFMDNFQHGKLLEIYNEFFHVTSLCSCHRRFAVMENYFIQRFSRYAGKNQFCIGELPSRLGGTIFQRLDP